MFCRSPESMLRAAAAPPPPGRVPARRLQNQLAHDDAHHEEEHDEGHGADAQALLLLDGNRVRGRHHVALPHPKAIVLLVGGGGKKGEGREHKVQKRR